MLLISLEIELGIYINLIISFHLIKQFNNYHY